VIRFVRAEGLERQQLKWMTVGIVASILLFPLAVAELTGVIDPVANLLFVLTLAIPVLRYRLWAIDTIIRRSLVYATITALIVPGYVLLSALGALVFSERVGGTVAAAVVVVAVLPLQSYTRQLIDRRVYGRRDDPYRAVSDLGRRLSETPPFGRLLPVVVETIAESLRLPYVAIEGADGTILTAHGEPGSTEARWSLTYEGLVEGHLVATPRRGEDGFDERDERLLADLARQAGSVVRAEALSADLIDSRQRLVAAREEERRRLRRDLHDGLGPILTAVGLNLDAARAQLRSEPGAAEGYIDQAKDAARQALDDVRRLVYGLRPPALDSLGLVEALRVQTSQLQSDQMTISICATDMPPLPAALEVAAYRTAIEAVTNSVRHVHASNCTVSLSVECEELVVDVRDDGRSAERWVPGVGLTSLREQADELGGTLTAGPTDAGGHVRARYPIVGAAV
jgi:signal transduction histidine kinase